MSELYRMDFDVVARIKLKRMNLDGTIIMKW